MNRESNSLELFEENPKFYPINYISGEMKNAVNGLNGFLYLLDAELYTGVQRDLFSKVRYSSIILTELVKSLDNVLEDKHCLLGEAFLKINLKNIMLKCITFLQKQEVNKSVTLVFDYDDNIPNSLYGNSVKLFEIVTGLLENAFLNINCGEINISVKLQSIKSGVANVYFEVLTKGDFRQTDEKDKQKLKYLICEEILRQYGTSLYSVRLEDGIKDYFSLEFPVYEV